MGFFDTYYWALGWNPQEQIHTTRFLGKMQAYGDAAGYLMNGTSEADKRFASSLIDNMEFYNRKYNQFSRQIGSYNAKVANGGNREIEELHSMFELDIRSKQSRYHPLSETELAEHIANKMLSEKGIDLSQLSNRTSIEIKA